MFISAFVKRQQDLHFQCPLALCLLIKLESSKCFPVESQLISGHQECCKWNYAVVLLYTLVWRGTQKCYLRVPLCLCLDPCLLNTPGSPLTASGVKHVRTDVSVLTNRSFLEMSVTISLALRVCVCIHICAAKCNKDDGGAAGPGYKFPKNFASLWWSWIAC